jgi:two-component system NtrC family response regulator
LEEERKSFDDIVGKSPLMKACKDLLLKLANSDANVLIGGETGTGKELLAWSIHNNSSRASKNFVVVDCASLPDHLVENILLGHEKGAYTGADKTQIGLIKQADGGTLFLDEVGELPVSVQKSFLRVLEERCFRPIGSSQEIRSDFRLISSTNRNLDEMVRSNHFRQDLLFRIRSFGIELPPLRNRTEDIEDIIMYHMAKLCDYYGTEKKQISHNFLAALLRYSWPGNVRELINALERSIVAARKEPILFSKHLPTYIRVSIARTPFDDQHTTDTQNFQGNLDPSKTLPSLLKFRQTALAEAEMHYLRDLMSLTKGNIKEACRVSGLSRSRLYALLKKYRISTSTN